jgi:predicted dehydrogenase
MCEDPEVEAVVAVMWFNLHYGTVRDLLAAGKHVATEKAICVTPSGANELASLAEKNNLVYQVSYMKRFDPGVRVARERIQVLKSSGEAGPMLYARIHCAHGDWTYQTPPPITTDETPPSYGVPMETPPDGISAEEFKWVEGWLNYYSHQTNLLRYVMGEDYALEHYHTGEGRDLILVQSESGVPAYLEFPHYQVPKWDEGFRVQFRQGAVEAALPAPLARQSAAKVTVSRMDGETLQHVPQRWGWASRPRRLWRRAWRETLRQRCPPRVRPRKRLTSLTIWCERDAVHPKTILPSVGGHSRNGHPSL